MARAGPASATFSPDGLTAYLTGRNLPTTSYDVLFTEVEASPVPEVDTNLSQSGINDRAPYLTTDGLRLYFTRTNTYDDIYVATRSNVLDDFGTPAALSAVNGPSRHDRDPYYVDAESDLYFSSERDESTRDLYQWDGASTVTLLPKGSTTSYVNMTGIDEERPVLSQDGLILYFSSKRNGIGNDTNGDIFMSTRANTGTSFGAPTNLVILNSSGRDFPVALSPDKCTLYFASNEDTGLGGTDEFRLYQATRPTEALPAVTLRIEIKGTGSVTTSPFNCSHTGNDTGGTGTCSANAAPNSTQVVFASSSAIWKGSCTGNNGNPSTDGVLTWANEGVCTIEIQ